MALLIPNLAQPMEAVPLKLKKNPIYAEIVKLNPKVDKTLAMQLSNSIAKYSKMFGTDPLFSVAIAMQETAFVNKNREGAVMTKTGKLVRGITDVGVFQIHVATIAYLGIDVVRLQTDIDYQAYWHTKILAQKIKVCSGARKKLDVKIGNEWSCYHSFTPSKRQVYLKDVGVHLAKLIR
jgi:hypothetical protein